jgi:F-type H+-transporting ATPase subunit b
MMIFLALAEGSIQLVPDGTILLHVLFVLLMVGVLNRVLFRPIAEVIAEREGRKKANLTQAAEIEIGIKTGTKRYREALRDARTSGYKLLEEVRNEGLRERAAEIEALKNEIERRVTKEGAVIQSQADEARRQLDITTLATAIRDQILKAAKTSRRGN